MRPPLPQYVQTVTVGQAQVKNTGPVAFLLPELPGVPCCTGGIHAEAGLFQLGA